MSFDLDEWWNDMSTCMRLTRARIAAALAIAVSVASVAAMAQPAHGTPVRTITPINCADPSIFVAQGTSRTQLYKERYGRSSASLVPVGAPYDGDGAKALYNAIAYNPADGFIYAISQDNNTTHSQRAPGNQRLLRIGETSAEHVGAITGVPPRFYNDGAFFNGTYYFMASGTSTLYKLDMNTLAATPVQLSRSFGAADFTQLGDYLWGVSPTPSTVWRLDPATGRVDSFAAPHIENSAAGAAWTFGNHTLGISDSDTGVVTQVQISDQVSASPGFRIAYTQHGPASANNDGTACLSTPPDIDLAVTKSAPATVDPAGAITWTIKITNNGPATSSGFVVEDDVPLAVTDVATSTPGCQLIGVGSNKVRCVAGVLRAGASLDVTLTGTAPINSTCIDNRATVAGNENDPAPANNTSNTVTTCVAVIPPAVPAPPSAPVPPSSLPAPPSVPVPPSIPAPPFVPVPPSVLVPTKVDAGYAAASSDPNLSLVALGALVVVGALGGAVISARRRRDT